MEKLRISISKKNIKNGILNIWLYMSHQKRTINFKNQLFLTYLKEQFAQQNLQYCVVHIAPQFLSIV
jgi:hypothetical protein